MSPEQGPIFSLMACSYRYGVTDKFLPLLGDALDGVIADTGATMGDLVDAMDDAQEQTIRRIDTLLSRSSLILKVAANERLMALTSRMLDSPLVKRSIVATLKKAMVKTITRESPPSMGEKVRSIISMVSARVTKALGVTS
jgi:hypothetical protein